MNSGPVGDTTTGLALWWKLDEGSGTTLADASGTGNTGANSGGVWTTGINNGALQFDGSSTFAGHADAASLDIAGSWTTSAWVNFSALPASGNKATLVRKHEGAGGANYAIDVDNTGGTISWETQFIDTAFATHSKKVAATISTGTWYHLAGVWDQNAGVLSLYVNGALLGTKAAAGKTPDITGGNPFNIGAANNGSGGNYAAATIDDVRVYNRALSATDIETLYTSTGGGSGDINSGLKGYWKFDEGSGAATADASGSGNTGTLVNSPTWTTSGKINGALTFAAGTDGVSIPGPTLTNTFTFATWVFITSNRSYQALFVHDNNTGIFLHSEVLDFCCTGSPVDHQANTTVPLNAWHHVAMVNNAGSATFYFDGAPDGTATSISGFSATEIGNDPVTEAVWGTMDDVRIYNRALSASDVLTLYNTTATSCAGPVGHTGDLMYNAGTNHVPQYCNGTNWMAMGKVPGAGGSGCTGPAGNEGDLIYNNVSRVTQYCDGTNWVATGRNIPISGLVGWWNLDEGSGTTAADSSGNGNTGTLVNSPPWTTSGKINGALTFSGATQYLDAGDTASLRLAGSWTIAGWVNLSALPASANLFVLAGKDGGSGHTNYQIDVDNGGIAAGLGWAVNFNTAASSTNHFAKYVTSISTGTWYHVAGIYDSAAQTLTLYLNGNAVASQSVAGFAPNSTSGKTMQIGAEPLNNFPTSGTLDDVRVYNRALSASEIWRLYNGAP